MTESKTKTPRELALEALDRMSANYKGFVGEIDWPYASGKKDSDTIRNYLSQEQPEPIELDFLTHKQWEQCVQAGWDAMPVGGNLKTAFIGFYEKVKQFHNLTKEKK